MCSVPGAIYTRVLALVSRSQNTAGLVMLVADIVVSEVIVKLAAGTGG